MVFVVNPDAASIGNRRGRAATPASEPISAYMEGGASYRPYAYAYADGLWRRHRNLRPHVRHSSHRACPTQSQNPDAAASSSFVGGFNYVVVDVQAQPFSRKLWGMAPRPSRATHPLMGCAHAFARRTASHPAYPPGAVNHAPNLVQFLASRSGTLVAKPISVLAQDADVVGQFAAAVAAAVQSAVTRVFAPDLALLPLVDAAKVVMPLVALRNHDRYGPLAAGDDPTGLHALDLELLVRRIQGKLQTVRVLPGTSLRVCGQTWQCGWPERTHGC